MLGQEEYDRQLQALKNLAAVEAATPKWAPIQNELELRTKEEQGDLVLHSGYDITCGNKGGKLSGG